MRRINYTDLDQMYRPGFIHIPAGFDRRYMSGYGSDNGNGDGQMLGGILASLFGKSQAWFDNVSRLQKGLTILQTEIAAFGKSVWDAIANTPAAKQVGFTDYDYTQEWALNHMKAILVTQSYQPNDTVIASADAYLRSRQTMVAFAVKVAPELAAQVAADRAVVESQLVGTGMKSPAVAGEAAFIKSLEDQASKLGGGMGMLGIGLAVAAAAFFLLSGRRSNPVLPTSWNLNPSGLFSGKVLGLPAPLVWGGGAFALWQWLKPKT
jgi:hypothetical protein